MEISKYLEEHKDLVNPKPVQEKPAVTGEIPPPSDESEWRQEWRYKGFLICRSKYDTGRWWLLGPNGRHCGWASDYHDAVKLIDHVIGSWEN